MTILQPSRGDIGKYVSNSFNSVHAQSCGHHLSNLLIKISENVHQFVFSCRLGENYVTSERIIKFGKSSSGWEI